MLNVESKGRKQFSQHKTSTHGMNSLTASFKKRSCPIYMLRPDDHLFFALVYLIFRYRVVFDFKNLNIFDILKL